MQTHVTVSKNSFILINLNDEQARYMESKSYIFTNLDKGACYNPVFVIQFPDNRDHHKKGRGLYILSHVTASLHHMTVYTASIGSMNSIDRQLRARKRVIKYFDDGQ